MKTPVIIDAVRTAIGRHGGALREVRPDDLGAVVIQKLLERNPIDREIIEDVIFGCANQAGEDNRDVARMSLLLAGLPVTIPGVTVNRLCGSGLEAVNQSASAIAAGRGQVYIAGGTESMTRAPLVMMKAGSAYQRGSMQLHDTTLGWRLVNPKMDEMYPTISLGETAENVAEQFGISREAQDEFALASQLKYGKAQAEGKFASEIVPVEIRGRKGDVTIFDRDEHPRPETTMDQLVKLKPAFRQGGSVTAGNSSGLNDGAAALLLMDEEKATELGLKPKARVVASAVAGVDPSVMGIGPIPATRKALKQASLAIDDIDLFEINEAFAAQALACIKDLNIDMGKVNVNGGAIALGHPLGCSGARILTTLLHEMERRQVRYGLATMCIGVGQGIATIIERV
ncbi:acetyl-CoA C-acyltransferase [Ammoniphilus sp. 3BR4]|uniref:thiolase family protein n=1 Tax=Ammoniphilus sp. 3BR4 TaxID=3158265 RepID=UPI0034668312